MVAPMLLGGFSITHFIRPRTDAVRALKAMSLKQCIGSLLARHLVMVYIAVYPSPIHTTVGVSCDVLGHISAGVVLVG